MVIIQGHANTLGFADVTAKQLGTYQKKHNSDPRAWADSFILVQPARILAHDVTCDRRCRRAPLGVMLGEAR